MVELREFVYIDNNSLNSGLSSLGKGIPSEITHATEDQTEKGGEGGARVGSIGAEGSYLTLDRKQVETTLDITAPYRFHDLLEELKSKDISIKENPDPRQLSRGDVVKVQGDVYPMAFLKIEIAITAFGQFADSELNDAFRAIGEEPLFGSEEQNEFSALSTIMEYFSGKEYPLRIEGTNGIYCTSLQRDEMRQNIFDAFSGTERFWLFGRVKRHVPGNEEWNPIHALNIIEKYAVEEDMPEEIQGSLRQSAEKLNISVEREDFRVRGHTAIIEPVAMYW